MGADFACAMLTVFDGVTLNWQAGQDVIDNFTDDELAEIVRTWDDFYSVGVALRETELRVPQDIVHAWDEVDVFEEADADAALTDQQRQVLRMGVRWLFLALEGVIEGDLRARDFTVTRPVPNARVYVTGGMSHGDTPTESSDLFWACGMFPEVLGPIGFDCSGIAWPHNPPPTRSSHYAAYATPATP